MRPEPANIDPDVVYGHRHCQTTDVKWLCLEKIYQKLHRPSIYDVGGTYMEDVPEYWFTYKTEQVGNTFLLHIFAGNSHEGTYTVGLSCGNEFLFNKKNNIAYLSETLKYTEFTIKENCQTYITTYNFTDLDVELLKDKKLYIALKVVSVSLGKYADEMDNIKAQHDFRALLTEPVSADFTVESAEGVKFKVHKIIMTSHSDVFRAMLKDDTAESQNNFVKLVDVATEDVRAMLEFIYTGTINNVEDVNFSSMLMLADRYNLKGLKDISNHALSQQMTTDNALDILLLADMYDCEHLKLTAFKYIKRNHEALNSSTFQEMKNMALIRELCAYMAS